MAANAPSQIDILKPKLATSATNMFQVGCPRIYFSKNNVLIDHTVFSGTKLLVVEHNWQEAYKEIIICYSKLSLLVPCALLLGTCTTVTSVYENNGTRSGSCIEGGPDSVTQQFYGYHIQHRSSDITALCPHLSDSLVKLLTDASRDDVHHDLFDSDPFPSRATLPDSANVVSASTTLSSDARNIPLRVGLKQGDQSWCDGVPMICEGQCWAVGDVRCLSSSVRTPAGTLRRSAGNR